MKKQISGRISPLLLIAVVLVGAGVFALTALRLNRRGIKRVRPLGGGFNEWRERGYPIEKIAEAMAPGGDRV